MSSQKHNQTAINSQRYRQQIHQQYQLLQKGNSASRLISLVEQFQLDPKCEPADREEIHYLIVGYIVEGAWLDVKHVAKRYGVSYLLFQLNGAYDHIVELAVHGVNEELTEFCTLFPKVAAKIKQTPTNYVKLGSIDQLLERAKLSFVMKVYAKYYSTLDAATITKTTGCKENQITELGYKIEGGFVEFGLQQPKILQAAQEVLLQKMRNLVTIADQMSTFE